MGRNCFCDIMRFLRLDMWSARVSRLQTALISAIWDKFTENYIVCYKPGENVTVDNNYSHLKPAADLYNTTYGQ